MNGRFIYNTCRYLERKTDDSGGISESRNEERLFRVKRSEKEHIIVLALSPSGIVFCDRGDSSHAPRKAYSLERKATVFILLTGTFVALPHNPFVYTIVSNFLINNRALFQIIILFKNSYITVAMVVFLSSQKK